VIFPDRLDDYVGPDDPVRAYDAFVGTLDFAALGIGEDPRRTGNPQYDPRAMMKLLLYGYSYGIFSSRKLERAVHHNVSFMWLVGGLTPDHKTIAEFRRNNRAGLGLALAQCARLCLKLGLVEGNILFVDSTKIWANAGNGQQHKKSWYEEQLKHVETRIEGILRESEAADQQEAGKGSLVKMTKDLARQRNWKDTIQRALSEIGERGERTTGKRGFLQNPHCRK